MPGAAKYAVGRYSLFLLDKLLAWTYHINRMANKNNTPENEMTKKTRLTNKDLREAAKRQPRVEGKNFTPTKQQSVPEWWMLRDQAKALSAPFPCKRG